MTRLTKARLDAIISVLNAAEASDYQGDFAGENPEHCRGALDWACKEWARRYGDDAGEERKPC